MTPVVEMCRLSKYSLIDTSVLLCSSLYAAREHFRIRRHCPDDFYFRAIVVNIFGSTGGRKWLHQSFAFSRKGLMRKRVGQALVFVGKVIIFVTIIFFMVITLARSGRNVEFIGPMRALSQCDS